MITTVYGCIWLVALLFYRPAEWQALVYKVHKLVSVELG